MKGTRNNQLGSLITEISGEPILRPYSGVSRMSNRNSVSPTFDLHNSLNEGDQNKEEDELQAFNGSVNKIET